MLSREDVNLVVYLNFRSVKMYSFISVMSISSVSVATSEVYRFEKTGRGRSIVLISYYIPNQG